MGTGAEITADGDEAIGEFAVLKYMFSESFDWAKSKPATFHIEDIANGLGGRPNAEAAIYALTKKKLILRDKSQSSSVIGYRISRAGVNYLAAAALGESVATPTSGSNHDSTKWTGAQFVLVDVAVIADIKTKADSLRQAVYALHLTSNSETEDLQKLADALVLICSMTEPEVSIIDRITASPKFKAYAGLIGIIATIRGALGF